MVQEPKKLYRSKKDKIIAGVCGGIAEYFVIDPVWVRLIAVLLIFANGIGVLLYIIAWIIVPKNPTQRDTKETKAEEAAEKLKKATAKVEKKLDKVSEDKSRNNAIAIAGVILVAIGVFILLKNMFSWFSLKFIIPAVLILIGAYVLLRWKK